MKKKTSSVEWLVDLAALMGFYFTPKEIQQAKEMHEKEMIGFAKWFNLRNNQYQSYEDIVNQYYNETYGSTKQD